MLRAIAALALTATIPAAAQRPAPRPPARAAPVRVALETTAGVIVVELATRQAPITARNFLAYVDGRKLDGASFYRASRTRGATSRGFIQGGSRRPFVFQLPPIAHEPTTRTGLRHIDGTISMARTAPGTARSNFFITVGAQPAMDADSAKPGDNAGFAAFGRVVGGMEVVRRILAAPTVPGAGRGAMKGQMLRQPVRIVTARRARYIALAAPANVAARRAR